MGSAEVGFRSHSKNRLEGLSERRGENLSGSCPAVAGAKRGKEPS
jgi:hypothetical protein